jgi:hypothetical protein
MHYNNAFLLEQMKLTCALFFFLGTAFPLIGNPTVGDQDEVTILLELMETGRKNLEVQQKVYKLLMDFKKKRETFLQDPQSAKLAGSLVKAAMRLKQEIEKNYLTHVFSENFLSEIRFFAEVGEKHRLSKATSKEPVS